jgi:flagellar protein FlaG
MSEISNITPAAIPVQRSQTFNASESSRVAVSVTASEVTPLSIASTSTTSTSVLSKVNEPKKLNAEDVKAAVAEGNTLLKAANNNLQFQVDEATKQVVIKIVDNKTGELVRQIPTVEMLDFIRAMKQQEANVGKLYKNVA